jgi:hypothetical protein
MKPGWPHTMVDGNGRMPDMKRTPCLNAFHRAYAKRMRLSAVRRSKQSPMSPVEFMAQVSRLRNGSPMG